MPSWNDLLDEFQTTDPTERDNWIGQKLTGGLMEVSRLREDANVLFYCSSFLQKPQALLRSYR